MNTGFLFINKKEGWTSRDICNKISHILNIKKVGHTGTLDPFATGLMIVSIGGATKAGIYLEDDDKEYIAKLKLGEKTETGDYTSPVTYSKEVEVLKINDIIKALDSFKGKGEQIPPMTSAIHHNGVKLYKLAHQGIEVERKPRPIEIKDIQLIEYKNHIITFRCRVSKGTYIRVLAEDIATKLNTVGHLFSLQRTMIGQFDVKDSINLEEVSHEQIADLENVISHYMDVVLVDEKQTKQLLAGAPIIIDKDYLKSTKILLKDNDGHFAIYEKENDNKYICLRGLN